MAARMILDSRGCVAARMILAGQGCVTVRMILAGQGCVAVRTTLRAAGWGCAGRHTLGGLGQRCGERIANCD